MRGPNLEKKVGISRKEDEEEERIRKLWLRLFPAAPAEYFMVLVLQRQAY